jgi:hypothetical protein
MNCKGDKMNDNIMKDNWFLVGGLKINKEWLDFFLEKLSIANSNLDRNISKEIFEHLKKESHIYIIDGELYGSKMINYAIELLYNIYRDEFIQEVCDFIVSHYIGDDYDDRDEYEITITYDNIHDILFNKSDYLFNVHNENIKTRYDNKLNLFNYNISKESINDFIHDFVKYYREEIVDEY